MADFEWTVMIYFAGDNNLGEEMIWAVKDIQSWWLARKQVKDERVKVVALFDAGGPPLPVDFDAFGSTYAAKFASVTAANKEKVEVEQGLHLVERADSERIEDDKRRAENMSDIVVRPVQETLIDFILGTVKKHRAEHYMLALSGHGSGAIGDFLTGDKRISGLTIPALGAVVQEVTNKLDRKLNVLGLDSCQMSMAEVMFQVQDSVKFMIGAEGFTPNTGWPYEKILSLLPMEPDQFAENAVRKYIEYYLPFTTADISVDIAAIALEKFDRLRSPLKAFTDELGITERHGLGGLTAEERSERLSKILPDTALYDETLLNAIILARREAQGYKREQYVDLWDFCSCLRTRLKNLEDTKYTKLIGACLDIMNAIDPEVEQQRGQGIVRLSGYCGPRFQYSNGLSIYFPWASLTDAVGIADLDHYQSLRFAEQTLWDEFLRLYVHATKREVRKRYANKDILHSSLLNRLTGFFTSGPGKDGQVNTGDKDGQVNTGDKSKLGIAKIESMKNPPTEWHESLLTK